jgi:hypothetical protein
VGLQAAHELLHLLVGDALVERLLGVVEDVPQERLEVFGRGERFRLVGHRVEGRHRCLPRPGRSNSPVPRRPRRRRPAREASACVGASARAGMETASRLLAQKVGAARAFLAGAAPVGGAAVAELETELRAVEIRFHLASCRTWLDAGRGPAARGSAADELARVLAAEDFGGRLDRLVARATAALRAAGVSLREREPGPARGRPKRAPPRAAARPPAGCAELQRLLDVYPADEAAPPAAPADFSLCPVCGAAMAADAGRSELRCRKDGCGAVRELVGTVFDDSQFYSQEGQKAKSGAFKPNRHFQLWWTHLTAEEPEEELGDKDDPENLCGEKLVARLRRLVQREPGRVLRLLSVDDVRGMLRELKRTDLNKNVPLLLKKLTGVGPPAIPGSIAAKVENIFSKAIEVGEKILRPGRANRNYYPDYILRIYLHVLETAKLAPAVDAELRRLVFYFYIQGDDTVQDDDNDWRQITDSLPDLQIRFVPLDRTIRQKYAPI